ncbi:hypothetical protein THTE_4066 [Thermogutta terrifontis]|uniref:Uncharacterized protein n=1 Tax=Thermogutta terrifontis TaxID=1331910 RepID=A0A286RL63_9BACT|nr:hypothetical protein THTE_4066 [Thermogutta terrifontis]
MGGDQRRIEEDQGLVEDGAITSIAHPSLVLVSGRSFVAIRPTKGFSPRFRF